MREREREGEREREREGERERGERFCEYHHDTVTVVYHDVYRVSGIMIYTIVDYIYRIAGNFRGY